MITLSFYEVPARDYQAQRKCNIASRILYRWREADWHAYRDPKPIQRWQSWEDERELSPTDDLVREVRKRRRWSK